MGAAASDPVAHRHAGRAMRVAVVAVHGVADQAAGTTARAVADLLASSRHDGIRYAPVSRETLELVASPLMPFDGAQARDDASRRSQDRPVDKSLRQSWQSDLHREPMTEPDRGIHVTDYLLRKHVENGAAPEPFSSDRIALVRTGPGEPAVDVHVHEMYWADLSRLSGEVPRILAEVFTLVFRLSKIGRGTVAEARLSQTREGGADRGRSRAWRAVGALQNGLDWTFVNVLSTIFLGLVLLAVFLASIGLLAKLDAPTLHLAVAVASLVVGALWALYRWLGDRRASLRTLAAPLVLVALGGAAIARADSVGPLLTVVALLGAISVLAAKGLRVADERFPLVRISALAVWGVVAGIVVWQATTSAATGRASALQPWTQGALFAGEVLLWTARALWIVLSVALVAWYVAGTLAARGGGYEQKASITTGRIGFMVSMGGFLMMGMAIWALLSTLLAHSVHDVAYDPRIFPLPAPLAPEARTASAFLADRYLESTATFAPLAFCLLVFVFFLVAMLVPSILAERRLLVPRTEAPRPQAASADPAIAINRVRNLRLGRWLSAGYRRFDRVVMWLALFALVLGVVGALDFAGRLHVLPDWAREPWQALIGLSPTLLKPLVIGTAGVAAALSLLGGVLSRYLPGLRAPLDVALDVDSHLRDFPRTAIPRARIFSRYAALLERIDREGYDRLVIVAHSQGTVITAELLRFLSSVNGLPPRPGDAPAVPGTIRDIRLLTLGCPLRQLYAARFPTVYRWVLAQHGGVSGPKASDIGVGRWINAFTSGDYIGRWLWSSWSSRNDAIGHPMLDAAGHTALGRAFAYDGFDPTPPDLAKLRAETETEVCLGIGAHTHYLEPGQDKVAWLADFLIRDDQSSS